MIRGFLFIIHILDLRDIREYTNCFLICGVRRIIAVNARSFYTPSFCQIKPPAVLPCKNEKPARPTLLSLCTRESLLNLSCEAREERSDKGGPPGLSSAK